MMNLDQIKADADLLNEIDWEMTPEEAVRLYLEWGNNWASSNYVIRSKNDEALYFVVNTWKGQPVVYLVRRNSEDAKEIARIRVPDGIARRYMQENGNLKGVYAIDGEVKRWLRRELLDA
ncbi:MAG: hypothetical protein P8010_13520 [Desulfosarcinaceae bacterium]|jgi:hypothetical protein